MMKDPVQFIPVISFCFALSIKNGNLKPANTITEHCFENLKRSNSKNPLIYNLYTSTKSCTLFEPKFKFIITT